MKAVAVITALFVAFTMAAPVSDPVAEVEALANLQKRGCPAGSTCLNGNCQFLSCASSGFCTFNPSDISC
ncbi:hypothetical protein QBC47DRAFT_406847 [Echria macrotheca]|uniref:Uncharacterized protein n=1 Tax=Echria macrotheca TaxID=438768 RepID=A0AAJ0B2I5_9PEZI|nr:hypothetical protein QBC47DRAFT_406847 [Echria macrotheca]